MGFVPEKVVVVLRRTMSVKAAYLKLMTLVNSALMDLLRTPTELVFVEVEFPEPEHDCDTGDRIQLQDGFPQEAASTGSACNYNFLTLYLRMYVIVGFKFGVTT